MARSRWLCPTDGERAFQPRAVNNSGSTLADVRIGQDWHLYDRTEHVGEVDTVTWRETGVFVASLTGLMHGVHEIRRSRYAGVL